MANADEELGAEVVQGLLALRHHHASGTPWVSGAVDEALGERLVTGALAERSPQGLRLTPEGAELAAALDERQP